MCWSPGGRTIRRGLFVAWTIRRKTIRRRTIRRNCVSQLQWACNYDSEKESDRDKEGGQHVDTNMTMVFDLVFLDWMIYDSSRIENFNAEW